MAMLLIVCSNCRTPLKLPPAAQSVLCGLCHAVTHVSLPPPQSLPPPAVIVCTNCRTALKLPPATQSVLCGLCHAVTHVSPPPILPPPPPPPTHGRKKAVIVGISYRDSGRELKGCLNDAKYMRRVLVKRFDFRDANILMLTDEETDSSKKPTTYNIRRAMCWLVNGCRKGDSLLFHYSGHGTQERKGNYNHQTLQPLYYETQGMIFDDEINATLVQPLPHQVKLHAIIDCCYSGTMLDLPFLCRMNRAGEYVWEENDSPSGTWQGTKGGEVISISGCDDSETAEATSAFSTVSTAGAMTFSLIKAIERGHGTTYGSILTDVRSNIININLLQKPQLASNYKFDVHNKPFVL